MVDINSLLLWGSEVKVLYSIILYQCLMKLLAQIILMKYLGPLFANKSQMEREHMNKVFCANGFIDFILVENVLLKSQVLGGKCEGEGEGGKGNCHFLSGTHRQRAMHLGKPIFVLGNKTPS